MCEAVPHTRLQLKAAFCVSSLWKKKHKTYTTKYKQQQHGTISTNNRHANSASCSGTQQLGE
jgi:hypothetical protein